MFITRSLTMAETKSEDADNPLWQGYSLQAPLPTSSSAHPTTCETDCPSGSQPGLPYQERYQRSHLRSLNIPSLQTKPLPRDTTGAPSASPPSLNTHHSYPSLKRAFHNTEDSPYGEIVREFREEMPELAKPSINQDHRLLSFAKSPEKHNVVDSNGRLHHIELSAQIHGMFFLSEISAPGGENLLVQPELTCYRRNLFQISGTAKTPRESLFVLSERGERMPIMSLEVAVSASESVDSHPVKLILIPWKTPPPNSPEVGQGQDHEPAPIPLLPLDEGSSDVNNGFSIYPIAYRRLQFRIATANNGRRRELQQHFTVHLNVVATLASGSKLNICETRTASIVVRGRSPRNFQTRKEIPLVGSSSSRGGLPDLHVATSVRAGFGPISAPVGKSKGSKPQSLELPQSPFTFEASPSILQTSMYPTHLGHHQTGHSTATSTPSYAATPIGLDYLQVTPPSQDLSNSHSTTMAMARPPPPARQQYTFEHSVMSSVPRLRFIDGNPRPVKSPRHVAPPQLPSNTSFPEYGARFAPTYDEALPPRDGGYFPTSLPMTWTTAPDTTGAYGTVIHAPTTSHAQHYQFPNESYVKGETSTQQNYAWNPT